jgi:2-methylfumaryl-CoA isomerase
LTDYMLAGLRVIELSAFVAAPLGGATLAAMGAEVIRIDPPGGGIDIGRWPLWNGHSLYWAGLNQGKRSVSIDTRSRRGRELITDLIVRSGEGGGILLTNLPVEGWLRYEELAARRPDTIMVVITGNPDGRTAVDYTINAAIGFPWVTGPEETTGPVNHVLPAWDALTGYLAATALLAAERNRRLTAQGQLVRLSLADVALAISGHLGLLAEAQLDPAPRPRVGNHIYGTFGHDFVTRDGRHVMVVALTPRQWASLLEATASEDASRTLETSLGEDLREEGARYRARAEIVAMLAPWFAERNFSEVSETLDRHGVLWGPYQTFKELVQSDPRASLANPMFAMVGQPGVGSWLAAGSPVRFGATPHKPATRAPELGEHTDQVLTEVLGLTAADIEKLRREEVLGP